MAKGFDSIRGLACYLDDFFASRDMSRLSSFVLGVEGVSGAFLNGYEYVVNDSGHPNNVPKTLYIDEYEGGLSWEYRLDVLTKGLNENLYSVQVFLAGYEDGGATLVFSLA